MRHFFTNRIRVVLVTAVLLAVVLAVVGSLTGMKLPQNIVYWLPSGQAPASLPKAPDRFMIIFFDTKPCWRRTRR